MNKLLIGILQHNKFPITEKCIKKIISNTTEVEFDIFVIDNASKDGSKDLIKNFCDLNNIKLNLEEKNHGVIGGRNIIFDYFKSNTTYSHLIFLDNDQFVTKDWIIGYKEAFNKFPDSIVGTEAWVMMHNLTPLRKSKIEDIGFTYIGCGGMMVSRKVVDCLGFYDEMFNPAYFEDPDYCVRALNNSIPVVWNTKSRIDHLPHQTLGQGGLNASNTFKQSLKKFRDKWKDKFFGGPVMRDKI